MAARNYVLGADGNPVPEPDLLKWAAWFEAADRRLAEDFIEGPASTARVSTVFLGADPALYETMIFWEGQALHEGQARYTSRADALVGHARATERVRAAQAAGL